MNFDVSEAACEASVPAARRIGDLVATSTFGAATPGDLLAVLDACLTAAGAYKEQLVRVDVQLASEDQRDAFNAAWVSWMPHEETRPTRTVTVAPAPGSLGAFTASALAWSPQSM